MGLVCKQFGLDNELVKYEHIQEAVARIVDGWKISYNASNTYIDPMAMAFATSLNSRIHRNEDIIQAFVNGIQQGTKVIAFYARRRPTMRRGRRV
ncbi:hypothetical protein GQ44DRAFT_704849 [Phaeosphaeriaceae sp. PMI808]|nr:hypothetical protein GQ44DRAFT_704849 [Phaeosphaeriaceae sp. PMI808]